jgi:hypothetical protein
MNTYLVSALQVSNGEVTGVIAQQVEVGAGEVSVLTGGLSLGAAQLEQLAGTAQVFVVRRTGSGAVELGSQVQTAGTRFVSVDPNGVENDDLMRLAQFHD